VIVCPFRTAELLPSQMPVGIFKLLLTAMLPLLSVGGRKIQDCHAHLHVPDAANAINTHGRVDLIARALEYGNIRDDLQRRES